MAVDEEVVKDVDGNIYTTVKIGHQIWVVENFMATHYNDGNSIKTIDDDSIWLGRESAYYCYYNNDIGNKNKFGALYSWPVIETGKLAPKGWHVPTIGEWHDLYKFLEANGYCVEGFQNNSIAKSLASKTIWEVHTDKGVIGNDLSKNNLSGFTALPGGFGRIIQHTFYKKDSAIFDGIGKKGTWWASDLHCNSWAHCCSLYHNGWSLTLCSDSFITNCHSVRLVKD